VNKTVRPSSSFTGFTVGFAVRVDASSPSNIVTDDVVDVVDDDARVIVVVVDRRALHRINAPC